MVHDNIFLPPFCFLMRYSLLEQCCKNNAIFQIRFPRLSCFSFNALSTIKKKTRGCHLILQSLSTKVKQIASTPIHIQCSLCLPSALASSLERYSSSNPMTSRLSSSSSSGPEDPSAAEAPGMSSMVSLLKLKMASSETCSSS
ncbi:hypothetical protein M431DRAFT_462103 [Trichoderma harzianum CBS 226.95]|uniref:Uncharacterized protein n=1 Tax=Trichoderma harzianum CBS 226.95 TaxID=983964 RepID=A0A2T4A8M4_TRIHA|nr:hypothetical protein M431DRAFT_462103 [Trichoderma harzianum CBS 226.95]PTB53417.1 hypothetical protein M431DRAFT_462103 [Trichoderma harzianum CBS 226.95]